MLRATGRRGSRRPSPGNPRFMMMPPHRDMVRWPERETTRSRLQRGECVVACRPVDLAGQLRPGNLADHLSFAILACRVEGAVRRDDNRKGWGEGIM